MRLLAGRGGVLAVGFALALASTAAAVETERCAGLGIERLAEQIPDARQFVIAGDVLVPLLELWPVDPTLASRLHPDAATVFARDGRPLLVALTRGACVVGAFEADRATVWRRLREVLGQAI